MQLYNEHSSPFAARVRIQIRHKGLPVEFVAPPGGLGSEEYRAKVPLARVPALDTGERVIGESLAIMEYLEDRFPDPPMRPHRAEDRAQMRVIALAHDFYVQPKLGQLFRLFMAGGEDRAAIEAAAGELREALAQLDRVMGDGPFAVGEALTLADCVLAPSMDFTDAALPSLLKVEPVLDRAPRILAWLQHVRGEPAVARALEEMQRAIAKRMGARP